MRALAETSTLIGNAKMRDQVASVDRRKRSAQLEVHPRRARVDLAAIHAALAHHDARVAASRRRTAELLAAVYANLADDGPRLVLADHLAELGDPRGELIALQCQGTPLTAEAAGARQPSSSTPTARAWLAELGDQRDR